MAKSGSIHMETRFNRGPSTTGMKFAVVAAAALAATASAETFVAHIRARPRPAQRSAPVYAKNAAASSKAQDKVAAAFMTAVFLAELEQFIAEAALSEILIAAMSQKPKDAFAQFYARDSRKPRKTSGPIIEEVEDDAEGKKGEASSAAPTVEEPAEAKTAPSETAQPLRKKPTIDDVPTVEEVKEEEPKQMPVVESMDD